jgi:hypothetical protein
MISTAVSELATVRRQPAPQRFASARLESMSADPYQTRAGACIGAVFTRFAEEIDATRGPVHAAAAIAESSGAADPSFEFVQNRIEPDQVFRPPVAHIGTFSFIPRASLRPFSSSARFLAAELREVFERWCEAMSSFDYSVHYTIP